MMLLRATRSAPALRRHCGYVAVPRPLGLRRVLAKGGMYVPSDSFGGKSPERKAAGILRTFFTFVAARVVLAQLEGSGRGALGAYDSQAATDLHHFLQNVPMKDGDEWLTQLMRQNSSLGLRLMEVRDSYCEEAFEWDQLQLVAKKDMKDTNTKLMRQFATASLAASLGESEAASSPRLLAGWRSDPGKDTAIGNTAFEGTTDGTSGSSSSTATTDTAAAESRYVDVDAESRDGGSSSSSSSDDNSKSPSAGKRRDADSDGAEGVDASVAAAAAAGGTGANGPRTPHDSHASSVDCPGRDERASDTSPA